MPTELDRLIYHNPFIGGSPIPTPTTAAARQMVEHLSALKRDIDTGPYSSHTSTSTPTSSSTLRRLLGMRQWEDPLSFIKRTTDPRRVVLDVLLPTYEEIERHQAIRAGIEPSEPLERIAELPLHGKDIAGGFRSLTADEVGRIYDKLLKMGQGIARQYKIPHLEDEIVGAAIEAIPSQVPSQVVGEVVEREVENLARKAAYRKAGEFSEEAAAGLRSLDQAEPVARETMEAGMVKAVEGPLPFELPKFRGREKAVAKLLVEQGKGRRSIAADLPKQHQRRLGGDAIELQERIQKVKTKIREAANLPADAPIRLGPGQQLRGMTIRQGDKVIPRFTEKDIQDAITAAFANRAGSAARAWQAPSTQKYLAQAATKYLIKNRTPAQALADVYPYTLSTTHKKGLGRMLETITNDVFEILGAKRPRLK